MGRPTRYKREYNKQARKLCLLGAIDTELADFFGVSEVTLNAWKKRYPSFLKSLKESKRQLDEKVVHSLFVRATGYDCAEDKIFCDKGDIVVQPTIKHYPPDPTSMIFWLKNRQPEKWKDKHDINVEGTLNINLVNYGDNDTTA